jgi:hypothetical protein
MAELYSPEDEAALCWANSAAERREFEARLAQSAELRALIRERGRSGASHDVTPATTTAGGLDANREGRDAGKPERANSCVLVGWWPRLGGCGRLPGRLVFMRSG